MISKMKKLLLAARTAEREKVLEILRLAEVVHVEPAVPEQVKIPGKISEAIENCSRALLILEQITPDASRECLATPGTPTRLVEETLANDRAIRELKDRIAFLNRELDEVKPWGDLGLEDLAWLKSEGLRIVFYKGPLNEGDAIEAEFFGLIRAVDENGLFIAASRNEIRLPEKFVEVPLPEREASQLHEEIQSCQQAIAEHEQTLKCLFMRRDDIQKHYVKLLNRKKIAEVESGIHTEDNVFVLTGWCPESRMADLQQAFEDAEIRVGMSFEDAGEEDVPPTLLENNSMVRSLGSLYDFMGLTPSYNEPDTSGLFLATLTIFAAFLIADAGYGLSVVLLLALIYKPLVNRGADSGFLKLGLFLFGGGAVYGLLTNAWFGETWHLVESYRFDPGSDQGALVLKGLCLFIGTMHLTLAHIMKIRRRTIELSTVSEVAWILFIWAMYGLICNLVLKTEFIMPYWLVMPLFKISITLILLFTAPSFNLFKSVAAGLLAIFQNGAGAFSDILSYIRLWAVGLAGGQMALAFNKIAGMLPGVEILGLTLPLLKLPFMVIGHIGNIVLTVISILSHGVRLNLLEFSNHLELDWAGRKYDPFKEIK